MRSKKRKIQTKSILLTILGLLTIGVVVAYLLREPTRTQSPEESLQFQQTPPKEFCSQAGQLCVTTPGDWMNLAIDANSSNMQLRAPSDTAQVLFSHDVETKSEACAPGDCVLVVIDIDNVPDLPDAKLVKAVFQRTEYNANVPSIFLMSGTTIMKYGIEAGDTVDIGVNELPTFLRKIDGKVYEQYLEGGGMNPGNYSSLAEAEKWFATDNGKMVDTVMHSVRVP